MTLQEEIELSIKNYFGTSYDIQNTSIIPSVDYPKLTFGNKGLVSELCFLFVDIRSSSTFHTEYGYENSAKIYQAFHDINVNVIKSFNGEIRAFDGDRIMAVFSGDSKCTNSVVAAMKIQWAIRYILNKYLSKGINCGFGIDVGDTLITKVGKGRDVSTQDLVWIGSACNFASHYCQEANNNIIISERAYNRLGEKAMIGANGQNMWQAINLTIKNGAQIKCYISGWEWGL